MHAVAGRCRTRVVGIVAAVAMCAGRAGAQGTPARLQLDIPGSLGSATALHCPVGEAFQIGMRAYDSTGVETPLAQYQPEAGSSNDTVFVAAPAQHSAYIVEAKCKANGRADLTVHTGNVTLTIPVVVGKGGARGTATPRSAGGGGAAPNGGAMPAADPSAPVNEIVVTLRSLSGRGGWTATTLYVTGFHRLATRQASVGPMAAASDAMTTHVSMTVPWTDALPLLARAATTREALQATIDFYATAADGTVGVQQSITFAHASIDTLRIEYERGGANGGATATFDISGAATPTAGSVAAYTGSLSALRTSGLTITDAILSAQPGGGLAANARLNRCSLVIATPGSSPTGNSRSSISFESALDGTSGALARAPVHWQSATIDFAGTAQTGQQVSAGKITLTGGQVKNVETTFTGNAGLQEMVLNPGSLMLTIGNKTATDNGKLSH